MTRKLGWALALTMLSLSAFVAACDDDDDLGDVIDTAGTEVSEGIDNAGTEVSDTVDDVQTEVSEATDDETPAADGAPSVTITAPDDGDTPGAGGVTVEVDVEGFDVMDKLGEAAAAGEGHVHFYLDQDPPTTPGQPAVTAEGTYHATATTSHTWEDVPAGTHTFAVQLVNNDHTPLDPPVVAEVTVEVGAGE